MNKTITLAPGLVVPIEIATQKNAILGMTGSGKSYMMMLLAEQFLDNHVQTIILDPKGEAFGLRLMADGKKPAYNIPVFGGQHGDLPLRPDMGRRIAELLVGHDYSAVLDVSEFTSGELAQFGYDFATRLFELKKAKPGAMSLMIDEAQDFIPQNPDKGGMEPKMLAAFERVGKQLRSKGVGMVIAGQRPQEINKKVLNMCECWFAFQMTGQQERETMEKIFRDKDREEAKTISQTLPKLEVGHAHVWSPRLLKISDNFAIGKKKTFDSSKTPEVGGRRVIPRKLSPVDVKEITAAYSELDELQKANDPELLKKQLREANKELAQLKKQKPVVASTGSKVTTPAIDTEAMQQVVSDAVHIAVEKERKAFKIFLTKTFTSFNLLQKGLKIEMESAADGRNAITRYLEEQDAKLIDVPKVNLKNVKRSPSSPASTPTMAAAAEAKRQPSIKSEAWQAGERDEDLRIPEGVSKMLAVLATIDGELDAKKLGGRVGISNKRSTFRAHIAFANKHGLLTGSRSGYTITDVGRLYAGEAAPSLSGEELIEYWISKLSLSAGKALRVLVDAGQALDRKTLADRIEVDPSKSTFRAILAELRVYDLIVGSDEIHAADHLFE